jgi:hypothetical protein
LRLYDELEILFKKYYNSAIMDFGEQACTLLHAAAILGKWPEFKELEVKVEKLLPDFKALSSEMKFTNGRPYPFPDFKSFGALLQEISPSIPATVSPANEEVYQILDTQFKLRNVVLVNEAELKEDQLVAARNHVFNLKALLLQDFGEWKKQELSEYSSLFIQGSLVVGIDLVPMVGPYFSGFLIDSNKLRVRRIMDNQIQDYTVERKADSGTWVGELALRSVVGEGGFQTCTLIDVTMKTLPRKNED